MCEKQVFFRSANRLLLGHFVTRAHCAIKPVPVCTENLNPHVIAMKSAKDRVRFDASGPLNWARDRRIFVQ